MKPKKSYRPILVVFTVSALLAVATSTWLSGFMGIALSVLAMLKFMDLDGFSSSFKQYDIVSEHISFYPKLYPFAELLTGLGFITGFFPLATGLVAILVGAFGAFSVYKSVYLEKKDLSCACVGTSANVPLGPVSLGENIAMFLMGIYLLL